LTYANLHAAEASHVTMKHVVVGVLLEIIALAGFLLLSLWLPAGLPLGVYLVFVQLMATYLVHCPAHFVVGMAVGVRFRELRLGKTTLERALPNRLKGLARRLPILTLVTDRSSLVKVSRRRLAAMYASGTVVSTASAFAIAAASTPVEQPTYFLLAWTFAIAYLAFDVMFSPKSGDLKRARAVLAT
jgi:hypothetical protein